MIDTVTQSSGSALRYIRPLLDTAKVWRSCKNSCSSFVFSFFRLLLHSESSLFGLTRLRRKPAKSQSRQPRPSPGSLSIGSTLWFDHSPAKKMDQPGVWLQNCALGCRSIGLEKARIECGLQSHHQNGSRRLDYSGARHSSRHDRGDAVRAEPARGQGLQIRDRF